MAENSADEIQQQRQAERSCKLLGQSGTVSQMLPAGSAASTGL